MNRQIVAVLMLFLSLGFSSVVLAEDDSLCAVVKITIQQELTIERQGFDAQMRIKNQLDTMDMENLEIEVLFEDSLGNPVLATNDPNGDGLFYIRVSSIDGVEHSSGGIPSINGDSNILASTTAEIHWLIVPAPGAGGGTVDGELYMVGAVLRYDLGGDQKELAVTPDSISVKPMPMLQLDYFLTEDVIADDAFTAVIEMPEPFTLGVRIQNTGSGIGRSVKIESAQPKITANSNGLLTDFRITNSYVNNNSVSPSLIIDFGDIESNHAAVGRWIMETDLSGTFTEFSANFSHSSELGGELTSLIDEENSQTHLLVRDVRVDSAGRDSIKDFLAIDGDTLNIYESDRFDDPVVANYSEQATITPINTSDTDHLLNLTVSNMSGFGYIKISDPYTGSRVLKGAQRSDGKIILSDNAWLSKERKQIPSEGWDHYINLFDVNSTGAYRIVMGPADSSNKAPVIQFIPLQKINATGTLNFTVVSTDPEGGALTLSSSNIPNGATFTDQGNGQAIFSWTPTQQQMGRYDINFAATDGVLSTSKTGTVVVYDQFDTDGDGISDLWEQMYFDSLDAIDGTGDFDGDGISDLDEFKNDTDPTTPEVPTIIAPIHIDEINTTNPIFKLEPLNIGSDMFVNYIYEVYKDEEMTDLVAEGGILAQMLESAQWYLSTELEDNTQYYWRVRVQYTTFDGSINSSVWAESRFFVNTENDAPSQPGISFPQNEATVSSLTPQLQVSNSIDLDGDELTYAFYLYSDESLTNLVTSATEITPGGDGTTEWTVDVELNNDQTYYWYVGVTDSEDALTQSLVASFTTAKLNSPPNTPSQSLPSYDQEVNTLSVSLTVDQVSDPDGDAVVYYYQLDTVSTFDSENLISSDAIPDSPVSIIWNVSDLTENTQYFWRVRVEDIYGASTEWLSSQFFINVTNDSPSVPVMANPADDAWVDTLTPVLEINPSTDPDRDIVSYEFELYSTLLGDIIETGSSAGLTWTPTVLIYDNSRYTWRVRAVDEHGLSSDWGEYSSFFVNNDNINDAPTIFISLFGDDPVEPDQDNKVLIQWEAHDPDSLATIALYYDTDNQGEDGVLIASGIEELPDNYQYEWDTSALEPGSYFVYAVITDEINTVTAYSTKHVEIEDITIVEIDNTDPEASYTGKYKEASWRGGYIGTNYHFAEVAWSGLPGLYFDNSDQNFSVIGDWEISSDYADTNYGGTYVWAYPNQPGPSAVIVDDSDPEVIVNGNWEQREGYGYGGSELIHPCDHSGASVTWPVEVAESGKYRVYITWDRPDGEGAWYAPVTIESEDGTTTTTVNERSYDGKTTNYYSTSTARRDWKLLGTYEFDSQSPGSVTIELDDYNTVIADAIYFVKEDDYNKAIWQLDVPESGRYQIITYVPQLSTWPEYYNGYVDIVIDDMRYRRKYSHGGGGGMSLGTYYIPQGSNAYIELYDDLEGTIYYTETKVIADGIKLIQEPDEPSIFTWNFTPPATGEYNVYAQIQYNCAGNTKAVYTIVSDNGTQDIDFNQRCISRDWYQLGTWSFTQGQNYSLSLSDEHSDGETWADAVRFERVEEQ